MLEPGSDRNCNFFGSVSVYFMKKSTTILVIVFTLGAFIFILFHNPISLLKGKVEDYIITTILIYVVLFLYYLFYFPNENEATNAKKAITTIVGILILIGTVIYVLFYPIGPRSEDIKYVHPKSWQRLQKALSDDTSNSSR
jgi:hypothetical protein